jgi:hypothetical protein
MTDELLVLTDVQVAQMHQLLDARQCEILFRRIGHGYLRIQSLSYIAKDFKLSRERIRQIQNEALVKLDDPEITHLVLLAESKATYERNESRRGRIRSSLTWGVNPLVRSTMDVQKEKFESAYDAWEPEEDKRLWDAHLKGTSSQELAKIHSRSVGAIRSRLKKIRDGLIVLSPEQVPGSSVEIPPRTNRRFGLLSRRSIRSASDVKSVDPHPSEYGNLTIKPIGKPEALLPGKETCPSCGMVVTGNRMSCHCS